MKVMVNGISIQNYSENNLIKSNAYDNSVQRITRIKVNIPTDNYTLTLVRNTDYVTDAGLVNWGDGRCSNLYDLSVHTYTTAGVYEIYGHFIFGLGNEPTDSMKEVLISVENLSNRSNDLSKAFMNCTNLVTFDDNTIDTGNVTNMCLSLIHI